MVRMQTRCINDFMLYCSDEDRKGMKICPLNPKDCGCSVVHSELSPTREESDLLAQALKERRSATVARTSTKTSTKNKSTSAGKSKSKRKKR